MRLYVVNVGVNTADAGERGLRSPVFPDGTFEFVPIKEESRFSQAEGIRSYSDLPLRERIRNNAHYHRLLAGDTAAFRILCGKQAASWRFHRALKVTPKVAGVLFGGSYDESNGVFRQGSKILTNKNGRPRRFDRFGSITRTIQCFLDSGITDQEHGVRKLNRMAARFSGRAG